MRQTQYPDPGRVLYPTTQPPPFPCQQTTRNTGKSYPIHQHGAWLNKDGDGNTDVDSGHFHRVRNFKVLADESDGHTHALTMLPCGAGAPQLVSREPLAVGMSVDAPDGTYIVQVQGAGGEKRFWTPWKVVGALALLGGLVVGGIVLYHRYQEYDE